VPAPDIELATAYLCGTVPQQKLGIGYASLLAAAAGTGVVESPPIELAEVNARLDRIAGTSGKGSAADRRRLLAELLSRLTGDERRFLFGLITGELRQGALEGLVLEAVARASGVPVPELRRAVMMAGDLSRVARAALTGGAAALSGYAV
jgi:DNA ligase 1